MKWKWVWVEIYTHHLFKWKLSSRHETNFFSIVFNANDDARKTSRKNKSSENFAQMIYTSINWKLSVEFMQKHKIIKNYDLKAFFEIRTLCHPPIISRNVCFAISFLSQFFRKYSSNWIKFNLFAWNGFYNRIKTVARSTIKYLILLNCCCCWNNREKYIFRFISFLVDYVDVYVCD